VSGARADKLDEREQRAEVDIDDPAWRREVEDLLRRSRALGRVSRRSQRRFGEWVPGYDAETADRVAARVRESIRRREPSSFIRLGDGEGKVLAFGTPTYPNLTRSALERLSGIYFGTANPLATHCAELQQGLLEAIEGATLVGIPTRLRLKFNRKRVYQEVQTAEELLGVWTVTELIAKQGRYLGLKTKIGASSSFHKGLLEHMPSLVAGNRIGLVTCHYTLPDAFRDRYDACVVDYYAVPPPVYMLNRRDKPDNGHFPGRYRELLDELRDVQPGVLYLVAAGMPGKVYCEAIRQHGGIALDIGHSMDVLAGVGGRKHVTREVLDRYQIVKSPEHPVQAYRRYAKASVTDGDGSVAQAEVAVVPTWAAESTKHELAQRAIERVLRSKSEFFERAFIALSFNRISGDYAEFGCDGGTSMWLAWQEIAANPVTRHMWAFDPFAGLPKTEDPGGDHPAWIPDTVSMGVDDFHSVLATRGVPRDAYTTVEGDFARSLPRLGPDGEPRDIALAHIDSDLYSSTVSVLEFLEPRLKHGMILAFDDYYRWSDSDVSGERAALEEFAAEHPEWNFHRYMAIDWSGAAFIVEDASWRRVVRRSSTGLPLEVIDRGRNGREAGSGPSARMLSRVDRAAVAVRPQLFAYQFIYELVPVPAAQ
jgi:O-methyltransferase